MQDLLPYMVRHQHDLVPSRDTQRDNSGSLEPTLPASSDALAADQQRDSGSTPHESSNGADDHKVIPELEEQWRCQVGSLDLPKGCAAAASVENRKAAS